MKFLVVISVLLSCMNRDNSPKEIIDTISINRVELKALISTDIVDERVDSSSYDNKYIFSDDTADQVLYVKNGKPDKRYQVPSVLNFKLIIHSKLKNQMDKKLEGIATLTSPNESFSDNGDNDMGDYFAADYIFKNNCDLKIRIDIEHFAACTISTTCDGLKEFIKSYPDYIIMKRAASHINVRL